MTNARRFIPLLVLAVAACVPGRRATLRPGSDMALPEKPRVDAGKKNGETCVSVGGVIVKGDQINCSPLAPDSTQRPPKTKPPRLSS